MTSVRGKIGRIYTPFSSKIEVNTVRMASQDISEWVKAIDAARNQFNPRRRYLMDLFENVIIDGHLLSVMNKRISNVTNKKVLWVPDGEQSETEIQFIEEYILRSPWFYKMLSYIMEAVPYGYSLIELIPEDGHINDAVLIKRQNVLPEKSFLMYHYANEHNGINYKQDPAFSPYLVEAKQDGYGLLMTAAQYVIYKRGGFGDWSQFAALFGMPFRVGKYDPWDDVSRNKLDEALRVMGGAGHTVIPNGTSLEFHDSNAAGKSEVFRDLVKVCNEEISKIFLGQTMTTEDGASRSQGQVHKEEQNEIVVSDILSCEHLLNWEIKDKLVVLGYPLQKGRFVIDRTNSLSLTDRIKVDIDVANQGVPIGDDYWYDTYGIPKPDPAEIKKIEGEQDAEQEKTIEEAQEEQPKEEKKPAVKKKEPEAIVIGTGPEMCAYPDVSMLGPVMTLDPKEIDRIAKGLYNGTIKPGQVDATQHLAVAEKLWEGVKIGYGRKSLNTGYDSPHADMIYKLRNSAYKFSAAKNLAERKMMTEAMVDSNGKIVPFHQFKKNVLAASTKHEAWLRTEYQTAKARARTASKWVGFETDKDMYDLQFSAVLDAHTRPDHARLNGITKPVDDPWWNTYTPPLDWNCRCDIKQVAKGTKITPEEKMKGLPKVKDPFRTNPAHDGVFADDHPYFKQVDVNALQAEKYYGMDNIDKIYADSRKLSTMKTVLKDKNEFRGWWLEQQKRSKEVLNGGFVMQSKITKDKIAFDTDLKTKILGVKSHENRFEYAAEISRVINHPDEVWIQGEDTVYLKYYQGFPLAVITGAKKGKNGIYCLSYYSIEGNVKSKMGLNKRRGILEYHKK